MKSDVTCRLMRGALALLLAGTFNLPARGQGVAVGRIKGDVRDQRGRVIVGAAVLALRESAGVETEAVSNTAGEYLFEALPIGAYSLTVRITGFNSEIRTGVRVVSGETRTMDFDLTVGRVEQTVTVSAAAPVLNTTGNTVGTTRVTEEISELPYALAGQRGRNAAGALLTVSGINYDPGEAQGKAGYVVGRAKINGAPRSQVGYYLDGVFSASVGHELTEEFTLPIPEEVAEVRLMTNQNAEYGWNSGTGYSMTFKSGTNQLHGSLFEYFRNTVLDSRNWFGRTRDINKQNDFGGVVGGPVVLPKIYDGRDRTFFFVSYDGFRFRSAAAGTTTTVPTAQMRAGDFRELLGSQMGTDILGRPVFRGEIYDPLTTRPDGRGGFLRDPFVYNGQLNLIDPSRLSAISKFFQLGYPLPTRPSTQNNWVGLPPSVRTQTDIIKGKIDEVLSPNHRFSFSWGNVLRSSDLDRGDNGFGHLINPASDNIESEYRYRFNYYWTIRSNVLLEVNSGVVRTPDRNNPPTWSETVTGGTAAGLKGTLSHYTPSVSIENWTGFGVSSTYGLSIDQGNSVNVGLSWAKGPHILKFGAQFQFVELYRLNDSGTGGSFSFNHLGTALPGQDTTGAGYASYLLGEVHNATLNSLNQFNRSMQGGWGFYAQDEWRVSRRLTVNYGLRWNLFVPTRIGGDAIGTFDPNLPNPGAGGRLGALTFWGNGPGRNGLSRLYEYYYKDFEPRIGFAYLLTSKTVIRAHYGITSPAHFGSFTSGFNAPTAGWSAIVAPTSLDNGVTPAFNWNNGFPLSIPPLPRLDPSLQNGSGAAFVDRKDSAKPGRIQNINLGIERELPGQMALRLDYVGTLAHALPTAGLIQLNQIPLSALSLGSLLLTDINSSQAKVAGIALPYPGFTGSVAQALRPYPQYQNVPQRGAASGFSLYHSLQVNLQKRVGKGLSLLVAYTLSKSLDNGEFGNQGWMSSNPLQHVSQLSTAKKLTNYDQPQALAISYVYELPFGPGRRFAGGTTNPVLKQLVGGWAIAGVQNYFSGVPVVIATTQSVPGGFAASGFGIWANRVSGVPITTGNGCGNLDPNDPTRNRYLNINAFATPAPFTLGNTAYLPSTRTCPYLNENFSLIKHFSVNERTKLEFGTHFFNAFNRHRWLGLQSNIGVAETFGRFTSASTPRQILLYLKINF